MSPEFLRFGNLFWNRLEKRNQRIKGPSQPAVPTNKTAAVDGGTEVGPGQGAPALVASSVAHSLVVQSTLGIYLPPRFRLERDGLLLRASAELKRSKRASGETWARRRAVLQRAQGAFWGLSTPAGGFEP